MTPPPEQKKPAKQMPEKEEIVNGPEMPEQMNDQLKYES